MYIEYIRLKLNVNNLVEEKWLEDGKTNYVVSSLYIFVITIRALQKKCDITGESFIEIPFYWNLQERAVLKLWHLINDDNTQVTKTRLQLTISSKSHYSYTSTTIKWYFQSIHQLAVSSFQWWYKNYRAKYALNDLFCSYYVLVSMIGMDCLSIQ